jgi:serine/threonine protein kinase
VFKLGFFSPNNSANIYLGVLYNISETTAVWVANRENPLRDYTSSFTISQDGNLVILDGRNQTVWSTNHSIPVTNSSAQLLDTGNFVLRDDSSGRSIWESFNHATDSFLPRMRVTDRRNGSSNNILNSWKNLSDPSSGDFFAGLDTTHVAEILVWKQSKPYWRSGPWTGLFFIGIPNMNRVYVNGFNLVNDNEGNAYFTFTSSNGTSFTYFLMNYDGNLMQRYWTSSTNSWRTTWDAIRSDCDVYGACGLNGICTARNSPICSCLRGFTPRNSNEWNRGNWTSGCVRKTEFLCERNSSSNNKGNGKGDGFLKLTYMKVPDFAVWSNAPEVNCGRDCLENCSCIARAFYPGIGCMHWYGNMLDLQQFTNGGGVELYVRLADSELGKKKNMNVVIAIIVIVVSIAVAICAFFTWKYMARRRGKKKDKLLRLKRGESYQDFSSESLSKGFASQSNRLEELPLYNFEILKAATDNFDVVNKLGEGGFGPVYKGTLSDGQEIAVKRLSRSSGQGLEEFMNEVVVISKLQHRNLVKLLGCCVDGDEKMLVYEYMPNRSLDALLFEPQNKVPLDWSRRVNIIEGIGRGLLYLHRDSRLRIIHRDLKASNILLDEDLTPKISDFGMARIFGGKQDEADTRRVVGTYGYMAPEYAMQGRFSEKSDVFSFGVLVLEIISGRRNTSFYNDEQSSSLIGHAWELWNEDKVVELIDPTVFDRSDQNEIIRCINVGLLCVQEFANDRPTISTVLSMLSSEISELGIPKQPAFTERLSATNTTTHHSNNITVTLVDGR